MEIVLSTFPSRESATEAARALVSERLAACVNIIEASSVYIWEEKMHEDQEFLCIFKTAADKCLALEDRIQSLNPNEVPEIARMSALFKDPYRSWVYANTH